MAEVFENAQNLIEAEFMATRTPAILARLERLSDEKFCAVLEGYGECCIARKHKQVVLAKKREAKKRKVAERVKLKTVNGMYTRAGGGDVDKQLSEYGRRGATSGRRKRKAK